MLLNHDHTGGGGGVGGCEWGGWVGGRGVADYPIHSGRAAIELTKVMRVKLAHYERSPQSFFVVYNTVSSCTAASPPLFDTKTEVRQTKQHA